MSGPWNAQQCEWLQALGHPVLVLAQSPDVDAGPATGARDGAAAAAAAPSLAPATQKPATPKAAHTPATTEPLQRALLRATGRSGIEAQQALQGLGTQADRLRGNPAAKRALWPQLRELRRQRPR